MNRIVFDFETRSLCDLKKAGAYKYSLDPSTQPTCLAIKIAENPEILFFNFERINLCFTAQPESFQKLWWHFIAVRCQFAAHNAGFEMAIYQNILVMRLGWPVIPLTRFRCTAAKAAACALPRSLENAGAAINLTTQKDKRGYMAMMKTCKPRKEWTAWKKVQTQIASGARISEKTRQKGLTPEPKIWCEPKDDPATWQTLYDYCKIDVKSEYELDRALPDLSPIEQKVWFLNQKINWRGVLIDVPVVKKIVSIMEIENKKKLKELDSLTMGLVTKPGARKSILDFLEIEGTILPDIRAKTVDDNLEGFKLSEDARRLLELRKALSLTSTKKYQSFLNRVCEVDGRVRDILLYHGASTGRDSGTGVQPQNFPRGLIKVDKNRPYAHVENVATCDYELLTILYGESLALLFSSILRNMIIASPGQELFAGDFSKIEVAVLWWLAGNEAGLEILRAGLDPYKYMAAKNTGRRYEDIADEGDERQLGKAQILGCLALDTPVLVRGKGFKFIQDIALGDQLWDGKNWVSHGGLVRRGLKNVIRIESENLESTPDHWFFLNGRWQTAVEIVSSEGTWYRRLGPKMETPPSSAENLKGAQSAVSLCAAYAELKKNFASINSGSVGIFYAHHVRNLSMASVEGPKEAEISWLVQNLESVGRLVTRISGGDAKTLTTKTSRGMVVAASNADSEPSVVFWNTLLHSAGLINGVCRSTELITMDTMKPETYESLVFRLTTETKETFDILDAGPNNCFQVSFILAHNCGFGMGAAKFQKTAWDMYRLKLTEEQSKRAVQSYRTANSAVPAVWRRYEESAIWAIEEGGEIVFSNGCKFFTKDKFLWVELPSGRRLAYRDPQISFRETEYGVKKTVEFMAVNSKTKKWSLERSWGGTLTENIVQAVARDLMAYASLRLEESGFKVLMTVHDEIICEKENGVLSDFTKIMCEIPSWGAGLPIEAKAWSGQRYRK